MSMDSKTMRCDSETMSVRCKKDLIYHLHPTFTNKDIVKINENEGFMLEGQGWGNS